MPLVPVMGAVANAIHHALGKRFRVAWDEPKAAAPHFSQCERLGGFGRAKGSLGLLAVTRSRVPTAFV